MLLQWSEGAKLPGKQCQLVRELFKRSEECFLEPECGEECETKTDRECRIEEEEQCRTVTEEQCDTVQVSQKKKIIFERLCNKICKIFEVF